MEAKEVSGNPGCYAYQTFDSMNDLFPEEVVKQPTRFRGPDNPGALGWILTENIGMVDEETAEPPLGPSDHCLLSTKYNCMIDKNMKMIYLTKITTGVINIPCKTICSALSGRPN